MSKEDLKTEPELESKFLENEEELELDELVWFGSKVKDESDEVILVLLEEDRNQMFLDDFCSWPMAGKLQSLIFMDQSDSD